jgi:spore coat polysaccharide biosynthesis protein SpsF (cytidylyltransferase family)
MPGDPTIGAILQARVGSTRLPGKVLKVVSGRSVLYHDIDRLLQVRHIGHVIVATTDLPEDQAIVDLTESYGRGVKVFRGSPEDVLDRFYQAARKWRLDAVLRVTSDCPLFDPDVSSIVVDRFLLGDCDLACNNMPRTYPHGLDTEVFSFDALAEAWTTGRDPYEREHVTPYIRRRPERFRLVNVPYGDDLSHVRLTLDYPEDLELISRIYTELYREGEVFHLDDVLAVLKEKPYLLEINKMRVEVPK